MARYINDIRFYGQVDKAFKKIWNDLTNSGFEYIKYDGESVFKKGIGIFTSPTFVKVTFNGGYVRVEAWIKYALLPGVYVGEFGMTGFVGAATKGTMKKAVAEVETIIREVSHESFQSQEEEEETMLLNSGVGEDLHMSEQYCTNCGIQLTQGVAFCSNCGIALSNNKVQSNISYDKTSQIMRSQVQKPILVSRKDFVEKYAQPSYKRDVKNIAILCYVCAGINALIALAFYPIAIIDSLLLVGFTLGMHLGKSKLCAIFLLILSCIEMLAGIITSGAVSGFLWVIAGIWAVVTFNKIEKAYKVFQSSTNF